MAFNENTRVKVPAILHLCRLGYKYISLKNVQCDESTNIFTDIFRDSIARINSDLSASEAKEAFENVSLALENEDLGEAFFGMLRERPQFRVN